MLDGSFIQKRLKSAKLLSRSINRGSVPQAFASYEEALKCSSSSGYEGVDLVKVVVLKTLRWRDEVSRTKNLDFSSAQALFGLIAAHRGSRLRVIDFGGGAGIHYFQTLAFMGSRVNVRWNVVETQQMVDAALPRFGNEHLKFFSSIGAAAKDLGRADLVLSNSSLPYSPEPLANLSELVALRAHHLYITRTPLGEGDESVTFLQSSRLSQNGPGPLPAGFADCDMQYPVSIVSRRAFEARLKSQYSVRFWSREASSSFLRGVGKTQNYSYFCDLTVPIHGRQ